MEAIAAIMAASASAMEASSMEPKARPIVRAICQQVTIVVHTPTVRYRNASWPQPMSTATSAARAMGDSTSAVIEQTEQPASCSFSTAS